MEVGADLVQMEMGMARMVMLLKWTRTSANGGTPWVSRVSERRARRERGAQRKKKSRLETGAVDGEEVLHEHSTILYACLSEVWAVVGG